MVGFYSAVDTRHLSAMNASLLANAVAVMAVRPGEFSESEACERRDIELLVGREAARLDAPGGVPPRGYRTPSVCTRR